MPATDEYYQAVGKAVWAYTGLEWNIVCVLRKIWPDYIGERYRLPHRPTGSRIHSDWVATIAAITHTDLKAEMETIEPMLKRAIERRNDFFHAHPATVDNSQILNRMTERASIPWTADALGQLVQEFETLGREANKVLHSESLKLHGAVGNWKDR